MEIIIIALMLLIVLTFNGIDYVLRILYNLLEFLWMLQVNLLLQSTDLSADRSIYVQYDVNMLDSLRICHVTYWMAMRLFGKHSLSCVHLFNAQILTVQSVRNRVLYMYFYISVHMMGVQ